ncbi:MAG: hypothetical protein QOG38_906 [Hyphomicrobiales bacterium]|nr:hypothetical protein [Hyphomicrobiales bacterium]
MTPARFFTNGIAATAVVAGMAFTSAPTASAASFDGTWSVLIVTQRGPCDSAYRYGLSIQNGVVFYQGSAPVNVSGRVSGNGNVSVRVWAGSQSASGSGRLARGSGRGVWRGVSSSGSCSGYWTAQQR